MRTPLSLLLLMFFFLALVPARGQVVVQRDSTVCDSIVWGDTVYYFTSTNPNYWTTVHHVDTLNSDTLLRWTFRINSSTHSDDSVVACNRFLWNGISFSLQEGLHLQDFDTVLLSTNIAGCPHRKTLRLRLFGTDTTYQDAVACDQYVWDEDGETYFEGGNHSYRRQNQGGCDSIVVLRLDLHRSTITERYDSVCHGNTYQFYDRFLTHGGHYNQNYVSAVAPYCDSIIVLILTELMPPTINFVHWVDCERLKHCVTVDTPVDYLEWSSVPNDSRTAAHFHSRYIELNPAQPTTYTLFADYLPQLTCPNSADIQLEPLRPIVAEIEVVPPHISDKNLRFEARDRSQNATGRVWLVDGEEYSYRTSFSYEASPFADSVVLDLQVYNQYCSDTAHMVLNVFRARTFTANAFTPEAETNNVFKTDWVGIETFEMDIFTRGGVKVFHTNDINLGWDGTHQGKLCPGGSYVYIIHYSDEVTPRTIHQLSGSVLLIR